MKKNLILLLLLSLFFTFSVIAQNVYVTKTGKKYHSSNCRSLSKSCIEISLSDAINRGYTPCSVCSPTTTIERKQSKNENSPAVIPANTAVQSKSNENSGGKSVQCSGTTKAGARCKRMTTSSNGRCYQHGGK